LHCIQFLENKGLPVFSKASAIINSFSRLSNTFVLQNAGIPMPETTITEDIHTAVETVKKYKEAVFKPLFSTKARGMEIITSNDDIETRVTAFKEKGNVTMYIQKRIDIPGKDLGVAFLGGKYVATYARVANKEFMEYNNS
jgi:tetrahydromethanopterin:alpha-L-glutamate ligase